MQLAGIQIRFDLAYQGPHVPWRMPEDACAPSGLELIALADEVILPRSLLEVCDLYHSARNPSNGNIVGAETAVANPRPQLFGQCGAATIVVNYGWRAIP